MTRSRRRWFSRLAAVVALWPASAEAQTIARSFEELRGMLYVSPGQSSGLTVSPLLGTDRQGIFVSVRF